MAALAKPSLPFSANCGRNAARAASRFACALARVASACATSGRRNSRSEGSPGLASGGWTASRLERLDLERLRCLPEKHCECDARFQLLFLQQRKFSLDRLHLGPLLCQIEM